MQTPSPSKPPPALLALPPYDTTSISRLQSLYSDISRQKHSNPASYHANIEWWRKALEAVVRSGIQQHGSTLVLSAGPTLMDLLRIPGAGKPLALASVVTELRTQKVLFTRSDFLNSNQSVYDSGWLPGRIAAYVVGKPLWWALEQLGVVGEEGLISNARDEKDNSWWGDYVVISLVEAAAKTILTKQSHKPGGPGDALYTFDSFKREFSPVLSDGSEPLSDGDAKILLRFLQRDRRAVIVDEDVIKFVDPDNVSRITAVDRGILELQEAVRHLHMQVAELQRKMDECKKKASAALQQQHKSVALTYLRSRKQFEDLLRKRAGSLQTLEGTLISVETAAGDVEIMKSYQSSTATLRSILSHPSLQRESIEKTMDAMAEANADAKEVDQSIRIGGDVALGIDAAFDDAEFEEELKMLAQEAEKDEADQTQANLGRDTLKAPTQFPLYVDSEPSAQRETVPLT
ncbi:Snf7-domain-containing protein [Mycena galericulata]|nr:Snf7-domain-containing protein [Mycena galericulata]